MEEEAVNGKALGDDITGRKLRVKRAFMIAGAVVAAALLIGSMVSSLYAQSYPSKPVRLILPMAVGGRIDILGRIVTQKLGERLGQPVVPENRPGGGGNVGMEFAAKARPDGYTVCFGNPGLATNPSLYKKLSFDPIRDFAPISLVAQGHQMIVLHPSVPVKNLKELVEYARANPGKLNYGSSGVGSMSHLPGELLKSLTKIDIVHVPYKGGGPSLIGLMGGEVQMVVCSTTAAIPQIEAGKVRAIAVLSNERLPALPTVPTAKEGGIDLVVTVWYGILVPAGTPRDIVNRLNAEWIKIAAMPDTKEKMDKAGEAEPLASTPEQFAQFIKSETVRWGKVIKEANLPPVD